MGSRPEPPSHRDGAPDRPVVLIIEDDFWTRRTAAMYLREVGYRVIEAGDAAQSIGILSSGTHVDFVFSDINMPGSLNGLGFARWLAKHHPALPILLTSGAHQASGIAAGAFFIAKPYHLNDVDRLIRVML